MAIYQEEYFPIAIVVSPLLLIPMAVFVIIKLIRYCENNILKGCGLKGGTGVVTKEFMKKYLPIVTFFATIMGGSYSRIKIGLKFTDQSFGIIVMSIIAFFTTILLCTVVCSTYMRIVYYRLFPDWGNYYKKGIAKNKRK